MIELYLEYYITINKPPLLYEPANKMIPWINISRLWLLLSFVKFNWFHYQGLLTEKSYLYNIQRIRFLCARDYIIEADQRTI